MLRALQSVVNDIVYNQLVVCGIELHQHIKRKISLFSQDLRKSNNYKLEVLSLGQLIYIFSWFFSFLKWDNGMDERVKLKNVYTLNTHTWEFEFWMHVLGVVKGYLTGQRVSQCMSLNDKFKTFLVWGVAHTTKHDNLNMKVGSLLQVLLTFYKCQKTLKHRKSIYNL